VICNQTRILRKISGLPRVRVEQARYFWCSTCGNTLRRLDSFQKPLTCTANLSQNRAATFCFTTSHDSIDSNSIAMDPAKRSADFPSHSPLVAPPPLPPGAVRLQVLDAFNRYRQIWPAWSATLRPGELASSLQGVSSYVRQRYVFIWK
jgi:hypothetical protein